MSDYALEQEIQSVEISIEHAKETVERSKAVGRLIKNKDFKKVVLDGYFEKEAVRLVLLKSDPNWQSAEAQKDIENQMIAIGGFRNYLNTINQLGQMAANALADDEATLSELRGEG